MGVTSLKSLEKLTGEDIVILICSMKTGMSHLMEV